jgi:hypothetical protein
LVRALQLDQVHGHPFVDPRTGFAFLREASPRRDRLVAVRIREVVDDSYS